METKIYIEGGGNSKEERARCREGFRKLFEKTGLRDAQMPRLVACGSRGETFKGFQIGLENPKQDSLMLVDSEDPVEGIAEAVDSDFAWRHLEQRDKWKRPPMAANDQVLLMATCMESWICADQAAIVEHYGPHRYKKMPCLRSKALKPTIGIKYKMLWHMLLEIALSRIKKAIDRLICSQNWNQKCSKNTCPNFGGYVKY